MSSPRLAYLKSLSREDLLVEIRRTTGRGDIVLWEMVPYGSFYEEVEAGPMEAAQLGVNLNDVIGYVHDDPPVGSALGDLMNAVPQNDPPYRDPFAAT